MIENLIKQDVDLTNILQKGSTLRQDKFDYSETLASVSALSGFSDLEGIDVKPFQLYKFRFYGLGLKSVPFKLYNEDGKKFFMYGKSHLLGTYVDIYFFALSEFSPALPIIAAIAGICAALGITLLVLKQVKNMSFIVYGAMGIFILIYFQKPIRKQLKL